MHFETQEDTGIQQTVPGNRRRIVDGLIVNDREVWMVVAGACEEIDDFLESNDSSTDGSPLVVCREVIDGVVVLGRPDPEHDALLSELRDAGVED